MGTAEPTGERTHSAILLGDSVVRTHCLYDAIQMSACTTCTSYKRIVNIPCLSGYVHLLSGLISALGRREMSRTRLGARGGAKNSLSFHERKVLFFAEGECILHVTPIDT